MKLRRNFDGAIRNFKLTDEHAASSYGQKVLVDEETGEAIDCFSFCALWTVYEATEKELEELFKTFGIDTTLTK